MLKDCLSWGSWFPGTPLEGLFLPSTRGGLYPHGHCLKAKAGKWDLLGNRQQHWDSGGDGCLGQLVMRENQILALALQGAFAGELAGKRLVIVPSSPYVLGLRWFHHFLLGGLSYSGTNGANRLWLS